MMAGKTITVAIMDAPYESPSSTTALRIINAEMKMVILRKSTST
jgi:hypothetical protein